MSESQRRASKKWDDKNREKLKQYKRDYYQRNKLELKVKRLTKYFNDTNKTTDT